MMNKKFFALAGLLVVASNMANTSHKTKAADTGKLAKCLQFVKSYGPTALVVWQGLGFVQGLGEFDPLNDTKVAINKNQRDMRVYSLPTDWYKGLNPATLNVGYTLGAKASACNEPWKAVRIPVTLIIGFARYLCGNLATNKP
jgi:hypothetical protein